MKVTAPYHYSVRGFSKVQLYYGQIYKDNILFETLVIKEIRTALIWLHLSCNYWSLLITLIPPSVMTRYIHYILLLCGEGTRAFITHYGIHCIALIVINSIKVIYGIYKFRYVIYKYIYRVSQKKGGLRMFNFFSAVRIC